MQDAFGMDVLQSLDNLFEQELSNVFLQLSSSPHVSQQITAAAHFHDVDDVGIIFKALVEPDDIGVANSLQDFVFLDDFLVGGLVAHERLVDGLQRHELGGQPVDSQVDLAKGSFSNHLADFIVLNFGVENTLLDVVQDLIVNLGPRRLVDTSVSH